MTQRTRNVAILLFNEVEVLDFGGPFEVFSVTGRRDSLSLFNVFTVAESSGPVLARNRLSINPHYSIRDCPTPGLSATTHHGAFDLLEEIAPYTRVQRAQRVVDNGKIILSAGISAGIDMSLHVVAKLHGIEQARETAAYMEYDWNA